MMSVSISVEARHESSKWKAGYRETLLLTSYMLKGVIKECFGENFMSMAVKEYSEISFVIEILPST